MATTNSLDAAEEAVLSLVEIASQTMSAMGSGDPNKAEGVKELSLDYLRRVEEAHTLLAQSIRGLEEAKEGKGKGKRRGGGGGGGGEATASDANKEGEMAVVEAGEGTDEAPHR